MFLWRRHKQKTKKPLLGRLGAGLAAALCLTFLGIGAHAFAAGNSFTLQGATKQSDGTYTGGTLYIKSDVLKSLLKYGASGLPLQYEPAGSGDASGLTGSNVSWEYAQDSPGDSTNGYWCAAPNKDAHFQGTLNIVMWQDGAGGQWNLTAFCNQSINSVPNVLIEPDGVPWGKADASRSVTHPSVGTSSSQTPPTTTPKIPDTSQPEEYTFTSADGTVINACNGLYKQFSKGCLQFTYQRGLSQGQSENTAYWTASGTANNVCTVKLYISVDLTALHEGQTTTSAILGGGNRSGNQPPRYNVSPSDPKFQEMCKDNEAFAYKSLPTDVNGWGSFQNNINVEGTIEGAKFLGLNLDLTLAGADEGDASTGCSFSINPLTWIACPMVGILEQGIRVVDNIITNALTINTDSVFDTSNGYYKAWSSFRILATAVIIIAGIVMVASQALGFEFLDAYTIRKVLPRLLIAIIGISLSWPLMRFVVEFFNTLGYDIRNLIYSPFGDMGLNTLNAGALLAVNGAILGTLFVMGIGATLSLLLTAALALLIGFVIIIVRDMAIIVLIIVVPIALACYVLPNTQKVWKLWSTNFMGLMMMFPIISAFIAVGKVFSAVSRNPSGSDSPALGSTTVMQIIGFLAYFLPYFLLPIAFRLATGVIGSIAGFVNDRNRGIFDRLKKGRQARMADRMQRARSNNLWDNNSKLGSFGNKIAGWATDPLDNAAYAGRKIPGFRKRGYRIASTIEHAGIEQSGKLAEEINKMGFNDKGLRALTGVHSEMSQGVRAALNAEGLYGKAPKSLSQLKRTAEILKAYGDGAEQNAANAIEGSMGRLVTLYQDPEMGKASVAAAGAMMLAQHGFLTPKDIPKLGDVLTAQGGTSFAQSVISQAAMIGQRSRPDLKNGYGWMYDKTANNGKGGFVDGIHDGGPGGKRDLALVASTSSHDVAGAKGGYMDDMKDTYKEILTTARTDTTYKQASDLKKTLSSEAWKAQSADVKRKAQAYDMYDATKDQLFQWAGPYSAASADVKTKSIDFIDSFGLRNEFEQTKRTNMSPEQLEAMRAAGQNPEAPGPQGAGPGGPGNQ